MMPHDIVVTSGAPFYIDLGRPGGTMGIFGVLVSGVQGVSPSLSIEIQTKNFADSSWSTAATFTAITTSTSGVKAASGLKQQVRLACTQTGSSTPASTLSVFEPSYLP